MFKSHAVSFSLAVLSLLAVASPALAGPPLICHPFQTGSTRLLTWSEGSGWNNPSPSYDLKKLTGDTVALLNADDSILSRMENLRRAAIYATRDPLIAQQLVKTLIDRALTNQGNSRAWFDAGYMVEAVKQSVHMRGPNGHYDRTAWAAVDETVKVDGYNFVKKAILRSAQDVGATARQAESEMEFAASLMTQGSASTAHRARASAGAARGSYLEKNLNALGF